MFKVILVDDNSTFLDGFYKLVKWEEYDMEVVGKFDDGKCALEYIKNNSLDVVITDISMPELSGVELARFLYENYPHIKIVFFSAFCTFEYAEGAVNYNVVSYIRKPIAPKRMNEELLKLKKILNARSAETSISPRSTDLKPEKTDGKANDSDTFLAKIETYVEEHYAEHITLKETAKRYHFNSRYFSRLFKELKGEGYLEYVNRVRIQKAQELLSQGYDAAEIYSRIGYGSRRYFFKQFSVNTGVTPAQYRKKMKEEGR